MSREMGRLILEVNKLMSKRGLLLNELKQIENGCDVGKSRQEVLKDYMMTDLMIELYNEKIKKLKEKELTNNN